MGLYKYNINIDEIDLNVPHGIILSQIQAGSTVLECGCATGYMTRYMSQKQNCKVYVVEYDSVAFDVAKKFAVDGICADLMEDAWVEKFQGLSFDYILFADVLEHIYDPLSVLKKAATLLKEDGTIYVSIPNVAHNDILINMLNDSWEYTETGLLDNTHIRFWGERNLNAFFQNANLSIVAQDYSIVPSGITEQALTAVDLSVQQYLNRRRTANVYQFVIAAQKSDYVYKHKIVPRIKTLQNGQEIANLYYSDSRNFDGIRFISGFYIPPVLHQRYQLFGKNTSFLRFDPIERSSCIVKNIEVISDTGELLKVDAINGLHLENYDVFFTPDPQYMIASPRTDIQWLNISCDVMPLQDDSYTVPFRNLWQKSKKSIQELQLAHDAVVAERADLINERDSLANSLIEVQAAHNAMVAERATLINERDSLANCLIEVQAAHDTVVQERDDLLVERDHLAAKYKKSQQAYQEISESFIWRTVKPVHHLIRKVNNELLKRE